MSNQHATRDHISNDVMRHGNLTATNARDMVDLVLNSLAQRLTKGESLELRGLGSFHLKLSKPRPGRNPMKPEQRVLIPARWSVKFRPGKLIKEGLQGLPTTHRVPESLPPSDTTS